MKNMVAKFMGLAVAVIIVAPAPSWGQGMGQQGMGQQGTSQQGTAGADKQQGATSPAQGTQPATPAPPPVNPAEEAAYKKLTAVPTGGQTSDPAAIVKEAQDFLATYNADPAKPSRYADQAYYMEAAAYMQLNKPTEMSAALDNSLKLNPNNVDSLAIFSMVSSRRIRAGSPNAAADEKKTEDAARQCIQIIGQLTKPDGITDEAFAASKDEKGAMCHSGLGLVELIEGKTTEAAQELQQATRLENDSDPVDLYLWGTALEDSKQYNAAENAFQTCLKDPGPMANNCKNGLDDSKKKAAAQPATPKQ